MMSMRGVITSATVVPASAKTPGACPARAGPVLRVLASRSVPAPSPRPIRPGGRSGRSGVSVRRRAPRRAGQLRRDRADDPGQQVGHDPHQADGRHQPDEPAGGRAGPPGDGRARCRAGEHQERQVRHVKVTGEGAARTLGHVVAAERAWQIGFGFRRQGEPGGPQREAAARRGARKSCRTAISQLSDVPFLSAPHGRAGAALTLGMVRPSVWSVPWTTSRMSSSRSDTPCASPRAPRPRTDIDVAHQAPDPVGHGEGQHVGGYVPALVLRVHPPHRVAAEEGDRDEPFASLALEHARHHPSNQRRGEWKAAAADHHFTHARPFRAPAWGRRHGDTRCACGRCPTSRGRTPA